MSKDIEKKIRRFSKTENERDMPFYKYYNPQPDPVAKQEKRKKKSLEFPVKKPKLKMKCIKCKDKKIKDIAKEEKKLEKVIVPITRKQQRENEERHRKEKGKYFVCKKEIIRLPSPIELGTADVTTKEKEQDLTYPSAEKGKQKVMPEKLSMTSSTLKWPDEEPADELATKIPKSKIYINKSKKKEKGKGKKYPPVDSIDFIYNAKYRKQHPWYEMYRGSDAMTYFPTAPAPSTIIGDEMAEDEAEEGEDEEEEEEEKLDEEFAGGEYDHVEDEGIKTIKSRPTRKKKIVVKKTVSENTTEPDYQPSSIRKTKRDTSINIGTLNEMISNVSNTSTTEYVEVDVEDEEYDEESSYYVPSIEKMSAATSIASEYRMKYPTDDQYDTGSLVPSVINRILQKYQRESEEKLVKQEKQPYKKGTLKSHSTSKIPSVPQSFYFGVKEGSIHYGDATFSSTSRYRQGLPICIAAYVMSFVKAPPRWCTKDIDFVLELGDKLFLKSLEAKHLHEEPRILQPEELCDYVELADKTIKYKIDEPDIAGFTRSQDPKIYNLLKGLTLFFKRHRSGIFQTYNTNILIFRQKFFFVFDPEPRTTELYSKDTGKSILASFYDIPSIMVMLDERGKLDNWPYIISKISIRKISPADTSPDQISIDSDLKEENLYKIVNPHKAVVSGGINIDDTCFGETRTKQGFAVATIAIVYSHVTPACAWHKQTVDKIILVANQFYIECLKDTNYQELKLENLPAFFTIGPLMIEITIFGNQYAGLMYRKTFCLFQELLTKFFCHNSAAIVEIDKFVLAIWRHREVFYLFDPYSRDKEGFKSKEGVACVTMNVNIETVVKTVIYNYNVKDYIFRIHALKVIRINRDPEFGKYPRSLVNSEESIIHNIDVSDKYSFAPKNITVDKTENAVRTSALEEMLDPSILEVGSFVGSIDQKFVPEFPTLEAKSGQAPPAPKEVVDKIIDLDSPSLSDTQIEKDRPSPLKTDSFEFRLLDEILQEEIELTKLMDYGEGGDEDYLQLLEEMGMKCPGGSIAQMQDMMIQKGADFGIIDKKEVLTNTDLMALYPFEKEVLEPNKPPKRSRGRISKAQQRLDDRQVAPSVSAELSKPSNFITLPDGSQILYGTRNIANLGNEFDLAAPFVSAVAIVMAKKYTLNTWSQEVVDAILDYGFAVHKSVEINFSDVPKIDIPRMTIGSLSFHVTLDYIFDSLLAQSILEQCLEKLVFRDKESAIVVTKNYSCAVFKKRCLYYMYDPYGNNLVGLGEGPDNTGVACMFRFNSLYALVSRFLYNKKQRESIEPTEASRFIISQVFVKVIFPPSVEKIPRREKQLEPKPKPAFENNPEDVKKQNDKERENELKSKNKVGYQKKDDYMVIEGTDVITEREEGPGKIKQCHFICICALIGVFGRPIKTWDTKRIDYVVKMGKTLFGYVDNFNFADKRNITNLLVDKYFFDMIVKRIIIADQRCVKNFVVGLDHLLIKHKFLLMQFPNCCFVLYKGSKTIYHLFDPYGIATENGEPKTCWIKFPDKKELLKYLQNLQKDNINTFFYYTINISHIKKASKKARLDYKLRVTQIKKKKKRKNFKVFHESEDWLLEYPIPWSRMKKHVAAGVPRGTPTHKWFNWDVEYPGDLYSLTATKHQCSSDFSSKTRNKQTIANCIVSIIMTEVYDFTEWNSNIMDSILNDGDKYFYDTFKKNSTKNYEVKVEDFPLNVNVFPYNVNIDVVPLIEGTMFLVRPTQFNLAKALRYFFEATENRTGIICCNNGRSKTKYVAFGRIREGEFFMYDCQTIGPPMFIDRMTSKAYMLRCATLNRLVHVITMTIRGGDFFIYQVTISEEQQEQVMRVEDLEKPAEGEKADGGGEEALDDVEKE